MALGTANLDICLVISPTHLYWDDVVSFQLLLSRQQVFCSEANFTEAIAEITQQIFLP
jgi:hypothetical protein